MQPLPAASPCSFHFGGLSIAELREFFGCVLHGVRPNRLTNRDAMLNPQAPSLLVQSGDFLGIEVRWWRAITRARPLLSLPLPSLIQIQSGGFARDRDYSRG